MTKPTKVEVCCADHDHSLGMNAEPPCVHGVKEAIIELTDAEIAEREASRAAHDAIKAEEAAAAEALAALKASAKAKLIAGQPLTEAEAATIVL